MKKIMILVMMLVALAMLTGCAKEEPTRENHYNTTIEETEFIEEILEETIIEETIIH